MTAAVITRPCRALKGFPRPTRPRRCPRWPESPSRDRHATSPPLCLEGRSAISEPNSTDSRLVAFASRGDSPNMSSTGNEIADPDEASVLTSPQPSPATSSISPCRTRTTVISIGSFCQGRLQVGHSGFAIGVDRSHGPFRGFLPRKTTPRDLFGATITAKPRYQQEPSFASQSSQRFYAYVDKGRHCWE